jgi:hypothetical protein
MSCLHKNLILYHGVLGANAAWRGRVVGYGRPKANDTDEPSQEGEERAVQRLPRHMRRQWAELMRRGFELDVLACPKCGGRLRLLALIMDRSAVRKLLGHANLPTEPPEPAPLRHPLKAEPYVDHAA